MCYPHISFELYIKLLCVTFTLSLLFCFPSSCENDTSSQIHLKNLFSKYASNGSIRAHGFTELMNSLLRPTPSEYDKCFKSIRIPNNSLSIYEFNEFMPSILYHLDERDCSEKPDEEHSVHLIPRKDWRVWISSFAAVLVISISGLVVVALVPLMSRRIYNVMTQFLIALSVGSLIGDAFLHLIPHALLAHGGDDAHGHSHDSESMIEHDSFVWKSVVVLLGIYAFFVTERLTILCQNRASNLKMKRNKALADENRFGSSRQSSPIKENEKNVNARLTPSPTIPTQTNENDALPHATNITSLSGELNLNSHQTGDNHVGVTFKYNLPTAMPLQWNCSQNSSNVCDGSSVPSNLNCNGGLGETELSSEVQLCNRPPSRPLDNARCKNFLSQHSSADFCNTNETHDLVSTTHNTGFQLKSWAKKETNSGDNHISEVVQAQKVTDSDKNEINASPRKSCDHEFHTNHHGHHHHHFPRAFPHRKKPHGHHHGHSHDLSSVRAIAYTIIAGDGLHNFCDGIAIGASFSESLQGGLSTALAVLCHELPHELGDFAVLLHAGMSIKSALFYNTLSSFLCTAGMILGVLLGSVPSVNAWLFLLTAGMFVYIALVDMMPELSTNRLSGYRLCHLPGVLFFWQNVGMLIGVGIMFIIANIEGNLA